MYAGLPPFTPPSSLYCSHRSASISSAAARNRRIAMSPLARALLAAIASLANRALPGTAAAAATPTPLKNDRRPTTRRHCAWTSSSWNSGETSGWTVSGTFLVIICSCDRSGLRGYRASLESHPALLGWEAPTVAAIGGDRITHRVVRDRKSRSRGSGSFARRQGQRARRHEPLGALWLPKLLVTGLGQDIQPL